ncbi:receptor-type guanylate cyclase gcy-12-like, partial [Copidosoma floridanum]|uniref:receptor-type guanylate cyclase gcy-12-like n=1 Tax=Copidosoma floridanum TaxID=29053 RepID=UPI0006C9A702
MRPGPPIPSRRRPPRRHHHHHHHHHQRPVITTSSGATNNINNRHYRRQQRCGFIGYFVLLLLVTNPGRSLEEPPTTTGANTSLASSSSSVNSSDALLAPSSSPLPSLSLESDEEQLPKVYKPREPQNLTIGYLTAIKGELKDRQGLAISGAFSMALDEVNEDQDLLPSVKLQMRWNDTRGETVEATKAMIDMICDGVVAFFGPEGSCHVEAIVAQSRNIPMISYIIPMDFMAVHKYVLQRTNKFQEIKLTNTIDKL